MTTPSIPSLFVLKKQARDRVTAAKAAGQTLTHSASLEQVAKRLGFKDWNACAAHASRQEAAAMPAPPDTGDTDDEFEELRIPFSPPWHIGEEKEARQLRESVTALFTWAERLETVADKAPESEYSAFLGLVDAAVPYLFEQNRGRWPDGLFHLVDRAYDPFKRVAFSRDELQAMGAVIWSDSTASGTSSDGVTVMDDDFRMYPTRAGLKRLARLLVVIGLQVQEVAKTRSPGAHV